MSVHENAGNTTRRKSRCQSAVDLIPWSFWSSYVLMWDQLDLVPKASVDEMIPFV